MMKKSKRLLVGFAAFLMMAMLSGCGNKYEEVVVTTAAVESEAATEAVEETKSIVLATEPVEETTEAEEPEERVEVDGKIRSYLTGEMVDVEKAGKQRTEKAEVNGWIL